MNNYLKIASKYLSGHKKKTRLTLLSVILAVALVVGIFSMLDSLVKFERLQVLKKEGNYHILIRNPSQSEISSIESRIDVENSGMLIDFGKGTMNNSECQFGSIDSNFAGNMNFVLSKGRFPMKDSEIVLEKWYMDKAALQIGDTIILTFSDGTSGSYLISGIIDDWGVTKAAAIPFVFLFEDTVKGRAAVNSQYFILFKNSVNIQNAKNEIVSALNIPDDRIGYNEGLLALMLQTKNNRAINIYAIGVILFGLVLITAVIMIYNTFNISVMDRVRQFGLLRCIGASKKQIKRIVRRESFLISFKAIPIGVLIGILMSFAGSAVLKYFNPDIYGDISIFDLSLVGITAGVLIGIMTVFFASLIPAQKAAKVSPVNAITGNNDIKISKRNKRGFLMKFLHAETAIGINNAISKKGTLILMSCSIAVSIILFFGFNILVTPAFLGVNTTKSYSADISLSSDTGISNELFHNLYNMEGAEKVFGRMSSLIKTTFDASRISDRYKESIGVLEITDNNLLNAPENSWIVSYDETQLKWAENYLSEGSCDEDTLNKQNGVIAVRKIYRNDELIETTNFELGDKIYMKTDSGTQEFTVKGIMDSIPYSTDKITMTTFITTEKLFRKVSNDILYKMVDIQLNHREQEKTVSQIKRMIDGTITFHDKRQLNTEANNAFMTVAVFIYGFLGVIALISVLNIINTMNTSVASRTKYLGTMRAVGMSGKQLNKMVLVEAVTYSLTGCIAGCTLGVLLQRKLLCMLGGNWRFPVFQVILTFGICIIAAAFSVIGSLKRIKTKGICEIIASL